MATKKKAAPKKPAKAAPSGLKIAKGKREAKEALFVAHYVKLKHGTKAAIAAGYAEKSATVTASQLLRKPNILEAVLKATEELVAAVKEETKIDAQWVLDQSVKVHNRCMQAEQVKDRLGQPVFVQLPTGELAPAFTFEHTGANKSLELIGKNVLVQAFRDQVGIGNPDGTDLTWVREVIPGKRKPVDP